MDECNEPTLTRMIYFLAQDMRNLAERFLSPHDLTLEQFQTLKVLSITRGVTQKQLGMTLSKTPGNLTRILDRLGVKSLIARQSDPNDRRVCVVFLTDRGQVLVDEVTGIFDKFRVQVYEGLSPEMEETTRKTIARMISNMAAMSDALKLMIK
ncbi:MAG: MarR family transcriptional regulator [Pseudomonadota bacterium]